MFVFVYVYVYVGVCVCTSTYAHTHAYLCIAMETDSSVECPGQCGAADAPGPPPGAPACASQDRKDYPVWGNILLSGSSADHC